MDTYHKQLFEEKLLTQEQERFITQIEKEEVVSVFFETRTLLYLGVLLLTSGVGLLIYQNLGQIGHFALITLLITLEGISLFYIFKNAPIFSATEQEAPTPYFDYVVLLAALLVISIFTYIFIQFDLLEPYIQWSSLVTAALFFFIAFRYDHKGVLTLAITAFTAFWGIAISPVNWLSFDFDSGMAYYLNAIFIGIFLVITGMGLAYKNIKKHFEFTFQNIGLILINIGLLSAQVESDLWFIYSLITIALGIGTCYYSWSKKEYLFFVYGIIAGYFSLTRSLIEVASDAEFEFWMFYLIFSMVGLIVLIQRINHAKREIKADDSI